VFTSKDYAAVRPRALELETQLLKLQGLIQPEEAESIATEMALIEREQWKVAHATRSGRLSLVVRSAAR
jgi:hypothetical protein